MSTTMAAPPLPLGPDEERGETSRKPARGKRAALKVLSAPLAALAALLVHQLLPSRQDFSVAATDPRAWLGTYPLLLEGILGLSLLAVAAQGLGRPVRVWVQHHAPLTAAALALLCLWDLVTLKLDWMHLPYFPGPQRVLTGMIEDRALLLESTWHSLLLLTCGYWAGVSVGLVTGVLMGWFPSVRYWGMPVLKVVGPIPATALIPIVMTVSSSAFLSGTALIGLAVWFPVTMLTASGIANVRLTYLDVARTLGAGRAYLIFRVALPAALPHIFIGLFMGLVASFLTLIVAETMGVKAGLGWYLKWQQGYMEYARVNGTILLMAAFFSTLITLLFKVRDYLLSWQKGMIKW